MKHTTRILILISGCVIVTHSTCVAEASRSSISSIDVPLFASTHLPKGDLERRNFLGPGWPEHEVFITDDPPQARLQYFVKSEDGGMWDIAVDLFTSEDGAAKACERKRQSVSTGTRELTGLGSRAYRPNRADDELGWRWAVFQRSNVIISIETNQAYETLLNIARQLDGEIQNPTRFAKLGHPGGVLSFSLSSSTVDEDKSLEFLLDVPEDAKLLQVRSHAEIGIANSSTDHPGIIEYTPKELGRDVIKVVALLKGERVLSGTCEIEVCESPERRARVEELTQILRGDTEFMERLRTLEDLTNLVDTRDRSSVPVLLNLLESESHVSIRQHIIRALSKIGDTQAVPALLEILAQPIRGNMKDRHEDEAVVRREAVHALGELGDQSILPVLRSIMENPKDYPSVRESAGVSIGQIKGEIPRAYNKE